MLDWAVAAGDGSMYNTPPCWAIYMCGLVFAKMLRDGGLDAALQRNEQVRVVGGGCIRGWKRGGEGGQRPAKRSNEV